MTSAPESFITIPEFDGPWPDASGERLLYIERQFHPSAHATTAKLTLLCVKSGTSRVLRHGSEIRSACWVQGANRIVVFESRPRVRRTHILALQLGSDDEPAPAQPIGDVPGEATGLAATSAPDGRTVLAFSAMTNADGNMFDPGSAPWEWSTGRDYCTLPVRTADSWLTNQMLSLLCLVVNLEAEPADPSYALGSVASAFNVLGGTGLEYKPYGGMQLTKHGLALVAGPHQPTVAQVGLATVYHIGLSAILEGNAGALREMRVSGMRGYSNCPRLSANGQKLIFLQKPTSWLEDEASRLVVFDGFGEGVKVTCYDIYSDKTHATLLSPLKVDIAHDATIIYFTADDRAEERLFHACISGRTTTKIAASPLSKGWSVQSFSLLPNETSSILLAGSTINIPRRWMTLDVESRTASLICQDTKESREAGLDKVEVESIEWLGAEDVPVQAWLVKPQDFDSANSYPLLYVLHGGPNAAFNNAWASGYWRNWNFVLLAQQGYVVVAPNATGSTGFGQDYARRVMDDWGGKGYIDHVNGLAHIRAHLPFVDMDRAVCLGTSYGAYMVNWIQGQPLGREFKALVAENGFVDMKALYTGDLVWFHDHFGGPMYVDSSGYDKFNPINHTDKWATPALVIANGLDYRVPLVQGLAVFQILQAKGIVSRFLSFPDEAHVTEKPENRLHWWRTVLEWCAQHTNVHDG